MERHGTRRLRLVPPPADEARQRELEQIVPGEDDELVLLERCRIDREPQVSHCAEPVLVRGRAVAMAGYPARLRPARERAGAAAVRHQADPVDLVQLSDASETPGE